MPPIQFSVDVNASSVDQIMARLEYAMSGASMTEFLVRKVHPWWRDEEVQRFAHQGDVAGGGTGPFGDWADLAPATVRIREANGYDGDGPINVRDGSMLDALINQYDIEAAMGEASMTIPGNSIDNVTANKIKTAQMGNPTNQIPGFGPTPPRPVLSLNETNAVEVLALLNLHIYEVLSGAL